MKQQIRNSADVLQIILALSLLVLGVSFGFLASISYALPGFMKGALGFIQLRPLHVSSVILWIILAAQAFVNIALQKTTQRNIPKWISYMRIGLLVIAVCAMFYSYFTKHFGGREYWEFSPWVGILFFGVWLLQLAGMLYLLRFVCSNPVFVWMWFTGAFFLIITFLENYAWLVPIVRKTTITDLTMQWKSAGSMVGAWNQLVYGLAAWLMTRLGGNEKSATTKMAFALYGLGLVNLMFNWGHHIYTLPTATYVRYISYAVSMTEWIILLRIIRLWRRTMEPAKKLRVFMSYRFLMAADVWIAVNLGLALLMSIPAINLFTHGTHITVAHSMGTTIGINTMILLGVCSRFLEENCRWRPGKYFVFLWLTLQVTLGIFLLLLLGSGIGRSIWQMQEQRMAFSQMMTLMRPIYIVFASVGGLMVILFWAIALPMLRMWFRLGKEHR
jgi:nitric oxide reductase subunit B